jgi:hypothetical protein
MIIVLLVIRVSDILNAGCFYTASTAVLPVEHGLSADKEGNAYGYREDYAV